MQAKLEFTDEHGHSVIEYDTEVHPEVRAAEAKFQELLEVDGAAAYRVETAPSGKRVAEQIQEFDPQAAELLITKPLVGG